MRRYFNNFLKIANFCFHSPPIRYIIASYFKNIFIMLLGAEFLVSFFAFSQFMP
ncbi:hypothetical protein HPSD74_0964 [Glaesserella parasuis D74]|nr:hypothetical protein HPSD74_0964 [Glaesserella parasuis D74]